jgi:hypothetical protein
MVCRQTLFLTMDHLVKRLDKQACGNHPVICRCYGLCLSASRAMSNWWVNVCYWHLADINFDPQYVRFRGAEQTFQISPPMSAFDPKRNRPALFIGVLFAAARLFAAHFVEGRTVRAQPPRQLNMASRSSKTGAPSD